MQSNENLLDLLERIGRELLAQEKNVNPRAYYQISKIILEIYDKKLESGELSEDEISEILAAKDYRLATAFRRVLHNHAKKSARK